MSMGDSIDDIEMNDASKKRDFADGPDITMPNDEDRHFLLYFAIGMYFGPDLKEEAKIPPKSALQRKIEDLPPYNSGQLRGSRLQISELEELYHSLLNKADKSLVVDSPTFQQFLQGSLPAQSPKGGSSATYPQFPDLFPSELHPLAESLNGKQLIENIIYMNSPDTSALYPEDVKRFKSLTLLEDLTLPGAATKLKSYASYNASASQNECYTRKRRLPENILLEDRKAQTQEVQGVRKSDCCNSDEVPQPLRKQQCLNHDGPAFFILPSEPSKEELDEMAAVSKYAYALTGSAAKGQIGPVVGLMDIGECEDSYLFRIALPGVKTEDLAFRCEVKGDGTVLIMGETVTGEKQVTRYTQVFEMQTQNLCPPGPFSISFQLPGPVYTQRFIGNFVNGILEGIVMKAEIRPGTIRVMENMAS